MGSNHLMLGREHPFIRDEGRRHTSSSIEAEIPHDPHAVAAGARREMLERETPTGERVWCQVPASSGHEVVNVRQHATDWLEGEAADRD
jgi:hypothetical protein